MRTFLQDSQRLLNQDFPVILPYPSQHEYLVISIRAIISNQYPSSETLTCRPQNGNPRPQLQWYVGIALLRVGFIWRFRIRESVDESSMPDTFQKRSVCQQAGRDEVNTRFDLGPDDEFDGGPGAINK